VPVLLYKLYGARTILNTIIQSLTPHNSMLNMSLVKHSVTLIGSRIWAFALYRPLLSWFCIISYRPPVDNLCAKFDVSNLARRVATGGTKRNSTKLGQKGSWRGHVTYFLNYFIKGVSKFLVMPENSWEWI